MDDFDDVLAAIAALEVRMLVLLSVPIKFHTFAIVHTKVNSCSSA